VRGTPRNPMSRAEVIDKCRDLIAPVLGRETSTRLIETVFAIESMTDVRRLRPVLQRGWDFPCNRWMAYVLQLHHSWRLPRLGSTVTIIQVIDSLNASCVCPRPRSRRERVTDAGSEWDALHLRHNRTKICAMSLLSESRVAPHEHPKPPPS
jgi:hypothetical protein